MNEDLYDFFILFCLLVLFAIGFGLSIIIKNL